MLSTLLLVGCTAPGYRILSIESEVDYVKLDMRSSGLPGPFVFRDLINADPMVAAFESFDGGVDSKNHFKAQMLEGAWRISRTNEEEVASLRAVRDNTSKGVLYEPCFSRATPEAVSSNGTFQHRDKTFVSMLPKSDWYSCRDFNAPVGSPSRLIYVFSAPSPGAFSSEDGVLHFEIFDPQTGKRLFHLSAFGRQIRVLFAQFGGFHPYDRPNVRFHYLVWQPNTSETILIDTGDRFRAKIKR